MVGMAGFDRRLAVGMAKQKLERGIFRQDGDLDRREPAQVAAARGEQQPAREPGRNATRDDGPVQDSRVLEVIKDEQCFFPPAECIEDRADLLIERLVDLGQTQVACQPGKALVQRFGGVDPEDPVGISTGLMLAIRIFHGELGLADPAHPE